MKKSGTTRALYVGCMSVAVVAMAAVNADAQMKIIAYNTYHKPQSDSNSAWIEMLSNLADESWHDSYYGIGEYDTMPTRPAILALTELGTTIQGEPPTGMYIQNMCNDLFGAEGGSYARSQIHAGSYEDYAYVYDASQVTLLETMTVTCGYRPAHRAKFRPVGYSGEGSEFYIYNVHLKAYSGEEGTRAGEVASILVQAPQGAAVDLPEDANVMFMGDFNFTTSLGEMAYDMLLDPAWAGGAVTTDPVGASVAPYPAYGGSGCPGAICTYSSGGPWSRIDLIFPCTELTDGNGLDVIEGSIHAHGNNNGSTRLYPTVGNVSDHLGVVADLQLPAKMTVDVSVPLFVLAGALLDVEVENSAPAFVAGGADELSYEVGGTGVVIGSATGKDLALDGGNVHRIELDSSSFGVQTGELTVTSSNDAVEDGQFTQAIELTVLDHADASFDDLINQKNRIIDFGALEPGEEPATQQVDIYSLIGDPNWTVPLTVDSVVGDGDTDVLYTDLVGTAISAGQSISFDAVLGLHGYQGMFESTWRIEVSEPDLPGAMAISDLNLTLRAYIAIDGDANLDGLVDDGDFSTLLANWRTGTRWSEGDFNGDEDVDDQDFSILLNNWGN